MTAIDEPDENTEPPVPACDHDWMMLSPNFNDDGLLSWLCRHCHTTAWRPYPDGLTLPRNTTAT